MNPKDILTNPTFCPMPWSGIMVNHDGKVKNCIRSVETLPVGNLCDNSIEDIVLNETKLDIQNKIINRQPVESCQTCYTLENNKKNLDMISDRIFYIREFKKEDTSLYQPGKFDLKTIDVRWSNTCNFACVYCGPRFSSKWTEELKIEHKVPSPEQKDKFKQYILSNAKKLKHVYMAGGEPLLLKENLELLNELDPDVTIRVNTNLSKTDTKVFEKICEFKNVHWTVSVETIEKEFEYIRHGGKWSDFMDNLDIIRQFDDHKVTFNMLYFALNYKSLFECIDYFSDLGFHNNAFIVGALLMPGNLDIRHLPKNVLNSCKDELQTRISKNPGYLLEDGYKNLLNYIDQPFQSNIQVVRGFLETLDKRRNLNSQEIFKDLYKLF